MPDIWPRASGVGWSQPPLGDCRGERRVYPGADSGKEPTCQCRRHKRFQSIPGLGRSPGGGNGNSVILPGESQGQRSLAGYSLWGHKESDMTVHCMLQIPDLVRTLHRYQPSALCFEGSNKRRGGVVLECEISPGS